MMNIVSDTTAAITEPWHVELYQALQRPLTISRAVRAVAHFDGHRRLLEGAGDAIAVAGFATPIRHALLNLAGVTSTNPHILARKMKRLIANRRTWADHPMAARLIEAAVLSDVAALELGLQKKERLLRQPSGGK